MYFYVNVCMQSFFTRDFEEQLKKFVQEYLVINNEINTTFSCRQFQLDCIDSPDEIVGEFHIQSFIEALGFTLGYWTMEDLKVIDLRSVHAMFYFYIFIHAL
jgi:hypothetical protein